MFKVFVNVWTNDGYDYIAGEYSGISYETKEEANIELEEAKSNEHLDAYIQEVK